MSPQHQTDSHVDDAYGYRARIGYTSPPLLTEVFPFEFYKVAPPGVTLIVTTLSVLELTGGELQQSADISLAAAKQMARAGANVVVLGGGPVNRTAGGDPEGVEKLLAEMQEECGVPIRASLTAQMHALRAVGARRVAGVQPFVDAEVSSYNLLEHYGFEPVAIKNAGYPAIDLGRVPLCVPMQLARDVVREHPGVDTVYFPCPHWAVMQGIEQLEHELGVNVVTSGQAIFWEAFRACGIAEPIHGFGKLLREC